MPKTFDSAKDIPDLDGKVILVTGGNAGLGEATVRALAAHSPTCIYIAARRRSSAEEAIKSIQKQHQKAKIEFLELDLNSFDSVKKAAVDFNSRADRLDLLFLNAGISGQEPRLSKDGYEVQFGVNHMGHALLTQMLMQKLLQTVHDFKSADVRIISISSIGGHRFQPKTGLALDEMKTDASSMWTMTRYGHSKLANILFAKKLSQVYPSITSTSVHPGTVKTEIWGKANGAKLLSIVFAPLVWATSLTCEEGAKTQLWCATAATGQGGVESGKFYIPIGKEKDDNENAKSQKLADELWQWTNDELEKHGAPGWPGS